jgi:hypothetical protein
LEVLLDALRVDVFSFIEVQDAVGVIERRVLTEIFFEHPDGYVLMVVQGISE